MKNFYITGHANDRKTRLSFSTNGYGEIGIFQKQEDESIQIAHIEFIREPNGMICTRFYHHPDSTKPFFLMRTKCTKKDTGRKV